MYLQILMLLFNGISYPIWSSLILPLHNFLNEFTYEPYHHFLVTIDVTIWDFSFFINFIFKDIIHLVLWEWFQPPFFLFLLACMVFLLLDAMFIYAIFFEFF
jgi:hypothetical protein